MNTYDLERIKKKKKEKKMHFRKWTLKDGCSLLIFLAALRSSLWRMFKCEILCGVYSPNETSQLLALCFSIPMG